MLHFDLTLSGLEASVLRTRTERVADSTLSRPDRSRPYPSVVVLPDQRSLHTGDGTPAISQKPATSCQCFVTCRSVRLMAD
ncbi:unnamed protein product [Lasius platythorax]|uniref:Uncharacterized protein n=1 Tax=Lasius platythorax TaxID=488582 RepID=A0AAV2NZH3_9HYME